MFLFSVSSPPEISGEIDPLARVYTEAVRKLNDQHAQKPGKTKEPELAKKLPRAAREAMDKLLKTKDSPPLFESLVNCGEAALDLDLLDDFERVRSRLEKASPDHARALGTALSRPRFLLRGLGGLDSEYLQSFAGVFDAVLDAYQEVFGFEEWSKVPGKKLRVKIHLEDKIVRPPRFEPQYPYHSQIDFPVIDQKTLRSPTPDGKFLFYGLCHELGHVMAMWGNQSREEDHHAWAHYTGAAIVEHLAQTAKDRPFMKNLSDGRWRSLAAEKKRLEGRAPSLADRDGVLALLIALHDRVGPKAIGEAINFLDRQDRRLRINQVRYYTFKELKTGLLATLKSPESRQAVERVFNDQPPR
ncbi:MAG: hypothetical protein HY717_04475 [Planctomycetes bacterium]|nr:hypothetical protein [Planctomycetota bacterium]